MKITDIKTIKLQYAYKNWIADGFGSCGARGAFLILVETDTELLKQPIETDEHMNYYETDKSGLGIELNPDVIEKYIVK